jgi:16S rRNA (cytosine1402-N4)-methyltransferase
MTSQHLPVLLAECLQFFENRHIQYFVDATLGAGGHSEAILKSHPEIEVLVGIDQDPIACEIAKKRLAPWSHQVKIVPDNFSNFPKYLDTLNILTVDGMLFDLGVSSMQLELPEKGFSFLHDGPLDMRMNPSEKLTAADIINTKSEKELGQIFREYGEEKRWRAAAKAIVAARQQQPMRTTKELVEVLRAVLPPQRKGIHPLTLIFQALRICVNRELDVLAAALPAAMARLAPGGRLAVISFHSLEDRIVKNLMRFAASDKYDTIGIGGIFLDKTPDVSLLTKKPITPREEEIRTNPRSRSAKLRVIEKR